MQISIIIPAYNEAENITGLISYLIKNKTHNVVEIIVVDGGSTDATVQLAKTAGALAVVSPHKGRAAQMNYGAAMAKGDILYFIHADTFPPASFANDIIGAVHLGFQLGRYYTKFNSHKWYLKINAWFTRLDWFICMGGDNTLFVVRTLFENTGGFKQEMRIMEEYEFCHRLRKSGAAYKIFNNTALVSARKYEGKSWLQVQLANRKIVKMYRKGASQEDLVETYKRMLQSHG